MRCACAFRPAPSPRPAAPQPAVPGAHARPHARVPERGVPRGPEPGQPGAPSSRCSAGCRSQGAGLGCLLRLPAAPAPHTRLVHPPVHPLTRPCPTARPRRHAARAAVAGRQAGAGLWRAHGQAVAGRRGQRVAQGGRPPAGAAGVQATGLQQGPQEQQATPATTAGVRSGPALCPGEGSSLPASPPRASPRPRPARRAAQLFKWQLARFAPQFSGYAQQDSQELLAFLLDGLHEVRAGRAVHGWVVVCLTIHLLFRWFDSGHCGGGDSQAAPSCWMACTRCARAALSWVMGETAGAGYTTCGWAECVMGGTARSCWLWWL